MVMILNDTRYILVQPFFLFFSDHRLLLLKSKNALDMNLGVGIRHWVSVCVAPYGAKKIRF